MHMHTKTHDSYFINIVGRLEIRRQVGIIYKRLLNVICYVNI